MIPPPAPAIDGAVNENPDAYQSRGGKRVQRTVEPLAGVDLGRNWSRRLPFCLARSVVWSFTI